MTTHRVLRKTSGVTLMEVTLAVAIFAVAIAMSAQSLVTFYAALDMQEQRIEAMQAARAVLANVRQVRKDYEGPNDTFNWSQLLTWVANQNQSGWQTFLRKTPGPGYLPNHRITVTLRNMNGQAANVGDDPIEMQVRSSWTDMRGRPASVNVAGIFSEK